MRISDWSSDVCSSDLGIPDQEQDRANYTVRAPRRPLQIPAGNRLDRARSALAPPKLACPCQRSADAIPALACLHRAPCGHCRARPASLRSEEHTSELQSLMRISYAVFCLTKQKNTDSTL